MGNFDKCPSPAFLKYLRGPTPVEGISLTGIAGLDTGSDMVKFNHQMRIIDGMSLKSRQTDEGDALCFTLWTIASIVYMNITPERLRALRSDLIEMCELGLVCKQPVSVYDERWFSLTDNGLSIAKLGARIPLAA